MTATLRVMLDQVVAPADPFLAEASANLARALVAVAPQGCVVEGVAPAGGTGDLSAVQGLANVRRTALPRRELAAAVQFGVGTGIGGGMLHSPTLLAPLVRHDRVHDHDQTAVSLWDLRAWDAPHELARPAVTWEKAMLKRAARHADAIVVPSHSFAARIAELAKVGDRTRVIAGAAPLGFAVPTDEIGRRRHLGLPEGFVVLSGGPHPSDSLDAAFTAVAASGVDLPVVVIDVAEGQEPAVADLAEASGIPERRLHVRGRLDPADRGAVFGAALAYLAPSRRMAFPWRAVEALALGVPVIASASPIHSELIVDGGVIVDAADAGSLAEGLGAALADGLATTAAAQRLAVLAADRGRAFSWHGAAERVWQLHADL